MGGFAVLGVAILVIIILVFLVIVGNYGWLWIQAMASGVPVVADNRGGWQEMIVPGETGLLASSPDEAVSQICLLANDERYRRLLIDRAYEHLRDTLANPEAIWGAWRALLEGLDRCDHATRASSLPGAPDLATLYSST